MKQLATKLMLRGLLWILIGVVVTVGTYMLHFRFFFISFGPVLGGLQMLAKGIKLWFAKPQESPSAPIE